MSDEKAKCLIFQVVGFVLKWRESVKELIYQREGVTYHFRE